MAPGEAERIGELLIQEGVITQDELTRAIADSGIKGSPLASALEASTHVRRADLASFLGTEFRVPVIDDLRRVDFSDSAQKLVPEDLARKHELVPIARVGSILCIAKANYFNRAALVDLHNVIDGKIKVLQADELQVRAAIERMYRGRSGDLPAPRGKKPDTGTIRVAPAPALVESATLEAIPLISMPDENGGRAHGRPASGVTDRFRLSPSDEVIEILDALRISPHEYASAVREPFARLVVEFDDLFRMGRAIVPPRHV